MAWPKLGVAGFLLTENQATEWSTVSILLFGSPT